jgi:hypothetical protein
MFATIPVDGAIILPENDKGKQKSEEVTSSPMRMVTQVLLEPAMPALIGS